MSLSPLWAFSLTSAHKETAALPSAAKVSVRARPVITGPANDRTWGSPREKLVPWLPALKEKMFCPYLPGLLPVPRLHSKACRSPTRGQQVAPWAQGSHHLGLPAFRCTSCLKNGKEIKGPYEREVRGRTDQGGIHTKKKGQEVWEGLSLLTSC